MESIQARKPAELKSLGGTGKAWKGPWLDRAGACPAGREEVEGTKKRGPRGRGEGQRR